MGDVVYHYHIVISAILSVCAISLLTTPKLLELGNSLVVQLLRICAFTAGSKSLIPGWGTNFSYGVVRPKVFKNQSDWCP